MSETKTVEEKIVENYDFSKPQKGGGFVKEIFCDRCGELNEYLWLPGYNCPEVKKSGFTRSKIIPGHRPPRAINCRCKSCGRNMRNEIQEDSPGTQIIDSGMTFIDDEDKEVKKQIREKIKAFNKQKSIKMEEEFAEEQVNILDSLYWRD